MNDSSDWLDCFVVGQGLAGSNLAWSLDRAGARALVIDRGHEEAASRVAAGLLNPVTGQRMSKSWQVDEQLPFAKEQYWEMERCWGVSFLTERRIVRLIRTEAELERWKKRKEDPAFAGFLGDFIPAGELMPRVRDELGGCVIVGVASLEPEVFLKACREWLRQKGWLLEEEFAASRLELIPGGVCYGGVKARCVVFCQGWQGGDNPWFGSLPFKHAKGEILKVRVSEPLPRDVISREKWLLPLGEDTVRVGSTFSWDALNCECTDEARLELLKHVRKTLLLKEEPQVLEHSAGVRPCSHDTKPYMGRHPEESRVAVFNGFGSKGALMTPLCAARMVRYLLEGEPLDKAESLQRLVKKGRW